MAIDRRAASKKLSEVLTNEGILTKTQVTEAAKYQRAPTDPLAPHLIRCGFITSWDLAKVVCMHFALPFFDLTSFKPKKETIALLEPAVLHGYGILPIDKFGKILTLAVSEALTPEVLQTIVDKTHLNPYLYVAPYDAIRSKLEEYAPYVAPDQPMPAGKTGGGMSTEEGDWMAIFEEAEKKMKGGEAEGAPAKG